MPSRQLNRPDGSLGLSGRVALLAVVSAVGAIGFSLIGLFLYLRI
jgi:hypothetical protein